MFATVSVTLSTTTLASLLERQRRMGGDLSSTIEDAVEHWLSHQAGARARAGSLDADSLNAGAADAADALDADPPDADPPDPAPQEYCGYQWKSLFLPEGTLLRSWSYGEHRIARVVGNRILHEGRSVSPNQFARSFARSVRNAWKDISICLPGEKTFQRAFRLRGATSVPQHQASPAPERAAGLRTAGKLQAPPGAPAKIETEEVTRKAARKAAARAEKSAKKLAARQASLQAALEAAIAAQRAAQDPAARQVSPGARWDLPERRTMRYRLEDVAFD